jgi:hypothetical protein
MFRIFPSTYIISKKMVELMGHSIESLASECLEYRSFVQEYFLIKFSSFVTENYR